ncbi:MAG: O-antigen ligase family protein [Bacteroidota bacterium]
MKSSFNLRIPSLGQHLAEVALLLMIEGMFLSRALLSVSIGLFFLSASMRLGIRVWLKQAVADRLVWVGAALWVMPFISGLWSVDLQAWSDVIRIKLPLLLLPLGGVGWQWDQKRTDRLGWTLVAGVCVGVIYSLLPWMQDGSSVKADYLRGGTLTTLLDNDRVRFSWLVVAMCWWMQARWKRATIQQRWILAFLILFFVFYLHVLAVRIGLVCFYLLAAFVLIRQLAQSTNRRWSVGALVLLVSLPVILYYSLPTFRARIDYIRYDWSHTFQGKYLPGGNDAIRMQSFQAAGELIRKNSLYGVGFGDIRSEMDSVYQGIDPGLSSSDRIYPPNEWAVYGVGLGWIGLIAFSFCMIGLFFLRTDDPFRWRSWVLATILSLVTDIGLEVQYGVFLVPILLIFFRGASQGMKNQELYA